MRTNIVINDRLMKEAMQATGLTTKRDTVDAALKALVKIHGQKSLRTLKGRIHWEGDLERSRTSRQIDGKA